MLCDVTRSGGCNWTGWLPHGGAWQGKPSITANGDGTEQVVSTDRDGTVTTGTRMSAGSLGRAPEEILQASRRINWREVMRP